MTTAAKCLHCEGWTCTRCHPHLLHRTGCNCPDCRGDVVLDIEVARQTKALGDLAPSVEEFERERRGG